MKNAADRADDPMEGTLPRREGPTANIVELICSITAADLKNHEDKSAENQGNDNERATASPEVHHLNN